MKKDSKNRNKQRVKLARLHEKISNSLDKIKYEIIYIDDGSTDDTLKNLKNIYEQDMKHTKILSFSRNFNRDAAILAGIKHSTGMYTCIMDSNLKHNPEYILDMFNYLEEDEELSTCVKREVLEETGILINTENLLPFFTIRNYNKNYRDTNKNRLNLKEEVRE